MNIVTKPASEEYLSNYDRIFRNKESKPVKDSQEVKQNGRKSGDAQEAAKSGSNGSYQG